ncbi:MAG: hypothetical protein FJ137_01200 [Deltaproteobacteria bacterium]|nr:hypothetical protein [Deltaproteobacteria bacterium]
MKNPRPSLLVLAGLCAGVVVSAPSARADEPAAATPAATSATTSAKTAPAAAKETNCTDHEDNDGDTVYDCGDTDCDAEPHCKPDGKPEGTNERCSNWIDDDGDGLIDCEDQECKLSQITVCKGSWQGDLDGSGGDGVSATVEGPDGETGGGARRVYTGDVEQPDSEGGVGFVGIRFGVVAAVQQLLTTTNAADPYEYQARIDTRFDTLQLRAFGALPLLEDSFFLLSMSASQSPRITFAMFQFPLGQGHYVNINSGGSTLSAQPLVSAAKRPLLDTPRYLLVGFDQFLDAGVEVNGPVILNLMRYRVFAGGGNGLFGDFGGRSFEDASINPTFTTGAQLWFTPIGIYNRFDSPFLFRPVPTALAFAVGGKYEQREQERFPAAHAVAVFRTGHFAVTGESYNKTEINYGSVQSANYLQLGWLAVPETIFLAADVGHFWTSGFGGLTDLTGLETAGDLGAVPNRLKRQQNQVQARAAAHWFFWRQNGVLTARYVFDSADPVPLGPQADRTFPVITHEALVQAQLRF